MGSRAAINVSVARMVARPLRQAPGICCTRWVGCKACAGRFYTNHDRVVDQDADEKISANSDTRLRVKPRTTRRRG